MALNEDWGYGFISALVLVVIIVLVTGLFNVHRPRVMPYPSVKEQCVVRDGEVEDCWPLPQTQ